MQPSHYGANPYGRTDPVRVTRARSWLVALTAFLVMLIIVAAVGNPTVTHSLRQHYQNAGTFKIEMVNTATALFWHFGDGGEYPYRSGTAGVFRNLAVLVLVFLLVAAVSRGRGTFWQLLFGTWACVVVAMLLGTYVYSARIDARAAGLSTDSRGTYILFGDTTARGSTLLAGLACGLVTALIAATIGVLTRRKRLMVDAQGDEYDSYPFGQEQYEQPYQQQPYQQYEQAQPYQQYQQPYEQQPYEQQPYEPTRSWDSPYGSGVPGPTSEPSPWHGSGADQPTTAFGRSPQTESGDTAALPPWSAGSSSPSSPSSEDTQRTQSTEGTDAQNTAHLPTVEPEAQQDGGETHETRRLPE